MKTLNCLLIVLLVGGALSAADTTTLAVPNRANSTPWVAATGPFVAVTWGAAANGKGDVFLAVSRDGGRTFSTPVRVNSVEGDARISGEIAPRVARDGAFRRGGSAHHRDVECQGRHHADPHRPLA